MSKQQDLSGQTLGHYELRQLLGVGGMGAVYRAYQANLKREVAIKVLSSALASDPDYLERFTREAETVASLEHPHIIPVYDYGVEDNISYIVMRLLPGGTLADRITQSAEGKISLPSLGEIATLLHQLAGAFDYAHSRGVIHRDVKPTNVMFDNHGNAFLVDFGIAKLLESSTALTVSGVLMGTPSYMSPEQWRAEKITPATDQYALGVMIYVLITGRVPFEAPTPYGLMYKHLNEAPTPPQVFRPEIPPALAPVLERAMAKQPADRYPSITALAQAFERAILDKPGQETNFFNVALAPRPATPATMVQPSGPLIGTPPPAIQPPPVSPPTPPSLIQPVLRRPLYRRPQVWAAGVALLLILSAGAFFLLGRGGEGEPTATPDGLAGAGDEQTEPATEVVPATAEPTEPIGQTESAAEVSPTPTDTQAVIAILPTDTPTTVVSPGTITLTPLPSPSPTETARVTAVTEVPPEPTGTEIPPQPSATNAPAGPTLTPTQAVIIIRTPAQVELVTEEASETPVPTLTPTNTATPTPSSTATSTLTYTPSRTPSPTESPTPTTRPSATPTPTETPDVQATTEALVNQRLTQTAEAWTDTPTLDYQATSDAMIHAAMTATAKSWTSTPTITPTPTATYTPSVIPTPTARPTDTPSPSPTLFNGRGRIVFVSERDGNREIYVSNPDGTGLQRLTTNNAPDADPSFSPDQQRIAFVSERDGNAEIYVMNADGSNPVRLTNHSAGDYAPTWSADGRQIAFASQRDGSFQVYVINADGTGLHRLTDLIGNNGSPAWSPDGRQIAFASNRDGNSEIYLIDLLTNQLHRLTNQPADDMWPAWSPDGRQLAFVSKRDGNMEIYAMAVDGSTLHRLTTSNSTDWWPAWSPDGTQIAFASDRDGRGQVYVMNSDGSNPVRLTDNRAWYDSPNW